MPFLLGLACFCHHPCQGNSARALFGPFFSFECLCGCSCRPRRDWCWRADLSWLASFSLGENFLRSDCVCSAYLVCLSGELQSPWKVLFCAHLCCALQLWQQSPGLLASWLPLDQFWKALLLTCVLLILLLCEVPQTHNYFPRIKDGEG